MEKTVYIGQVAADTGATPKAIRLYEEMGLLPPAQRKGKYRVYTPRDTERVRIIREAQRQGFALKEMQRLIERSNSCAGFDWDEALRMVAQKRREVQEQIERLTVRALELEQLAAELQRKNCPNG